MQKRSTRKMDFKCFFPLCVSLLSVLLIEVHVTSGRQLDIVLLFDSSDNARSANFETEKAFLMNLTRALFTPDVRIGVYTFGAHTYNQFTMDMYTDLPTVQQSIEYMWYSTGNGAVEPAINYTVNEAFQSALGDRDCVANVLIVFTHVGIKDVYFAEDIRRVLAKKSIHSLVLNMANTSDATHFAAVTNNMSRVLNIHDWQSLQQSITKIVNVLNTDPDIGDTGCGVLTEWESWSRCSQTCGTGAHFRTRQCIKKTPTEKDCNAEFSEYKLCSITTCTDPVDGDWAFWTQWSSCTKSCATGSQTRTRTCTLPAPLNGGRTCIGNNTQSRQCATYPCPDCSNPCPPGGRRSQDCKICECSNVVLFGQIFNDNNETVREANIFLESSKYSQLMKTDIFGKFEISHVCLMNEVVYIKADRCVDKHITPIAVNSSHWTLPAFRLERTVPPILIVQPSDKVRMVGQSLSLCCAAAGNPSPKSYIWYKDGVQLDHLGTNGTLFLSPLKPTDSGQYKCTTETEAGLTQSHVATVVVKHASKDTCDSPTPLLQTLPPGCYVSGDDTKNNTLNVGSCGKLACMRSALHDNGSCADSWPYHCCEDKDVQSVDIECEGFRYKTSRVTSCECKLCMFKSIVSGKAFGRQNGSDIPFQLGDIIINGEVISRTSMSGYFTFELSKGIRRIVVSFHDSIFKKFADVTKIIQVNEGRDTYATIVIPLMPKPLLFDSSNGTEINLGVNDDGIPPAAKISIQPDSVVTPDGKPFTGEVKTLIHFMDPRNRDEIEAANGDFESEGPDGRKVPLKTFGMYQLTLTDNNGTDLFVNKPIEFSLDASIFDIPLDENGNPDVSLWTYDTNKGTWVEIAKLKKAHEQTAGQRRLLESELLVNYTLTSIPPVKTTQETVTYVSQFTGRYTNCDHNTPIMELVPYVINEPVKGVCHVSVSVYKDLNLVEAYGEPDVVIKTYVQHPKSKTFLGANTVKVEKGHACVPVFCGHNVYMHALRGISESMFAGRHYLPHKGIVAQKTAHEIMFVANPFGNFDESLYNSTTYFKGPIFTAADETLCQERLSPLDNHFTFKFAPFTKASTLYYAIGSGKYDEKMAWYPVSPSAMTFRTCFMKIYIKVENGHDIRFIAKSLLHTLNGDEFGTHDVGPTPDPRVNDTTNRGACIEFRCPGLVSDSGKSYYNLSTAIQVNMAGGSSLNCTSKVAPGLTITKITNASRGDVGFTFIALAGNNYGPRFGVFIADKPAGVTEQFCNSGVDTGKSMDGVMAPSRNPAVTFDCK